MQKYESFEIYTEKQNSFVTKTACSWQSIAYQNIKFNLIVVDIPLCLSTNYHVKRVQKFCNNNFIGIYHILVGYTFTKFLMKNSAAVFRFVTLLIFSTIKTTVCNLRLIYHFWLYFYARKRIQNSVAISFG